MKSVHPRNWIKTRTNGVPYHAALIPNAHFKSLSRDRLTRETKLCVCLSMRNVQLSFNETFKLYELTQKVVSSLILYAYNVQFN